MTLLFRNALGLHNYVGFRCHDFAGATKMSKYIVVDGTITLGFRAYGTFDNQTTAHEWAKHNLKDDTECAFAWWTMPIRNPGIPESNTRQNIKSKGLSHD